MPELEAQLWKHVRDLVGQEVLKETIATTLLDMAITAGAKDIDPPLVSAGYFFTIFKELRPGVYTPAPEVRPEAPEDIDDPTTVTLKSFRDIAYTYKEHSGLEWQHLLPGMQRMCIIYIYAMKYRGKERTLELFRDQVNKLAPLLDQCEQNPPQDLPLTPLHTKNIAKFNKIFEKGAPRFA